MSLGWCPEAVQIVDEDQGKSGASAQERTGFTRLAHDVAHGEVGAILAVEASRLARSSQDWQRLLSLCAVAQVVVIDENTVYDPSHHDDKLLLDLKGAMSEQELHWLSLRLAGGRLNKARRGESYVTPPTGYVWGGRSLELDPDESVQNAVRLIFERFSVEPSARSLLRWAHRSNFLIPTRRRGSSEITPKLLGNVRLNDMLHNPTYAGVYVFGRRPTSKKLVDGEIRKVRTRLDQPTDWPVRIDNAHPAYITWETYMSNQEKLRQNTTIANRASRGAPREGPALLAGVALCGRCGRRMSARYETGSSRWHYFCYGDTTKGNVYCWSVPGAPIDQAVEKLFLQTMVPTEIELSLAVEREVGSQADTLEKAWLTRIEQAGYETRRAERRYKAVDPDNRVVARTLESEWEQRLRELEAVQQQYAEARRQRRVELNTQDRQRIRELSRDLSAVWKACTTSMADRKAMLRLVIEAVALHPVDVPKRATRIRVQWHSGVVSELEVTRPGRGEQHKQAPEVVQSIRELARAGNHDDEIAQKLNAQGHRSGTGRVWNEALVYTARRNAGIKRVAPDRPRKFPLPHLYPDGRYSVPGVMARFGVSEAMVHRWIQDGIIRTSRADFGTSRNAHWIDIDEVTAARLIKQRRAARKSPKE
jgi:DNA invertase Pin-like site-specific DNA recombinase